jgi:hypothetical protein
MVLTNQSADGGDRLDDFIRHAAGVVSVEGIQTVIQVIDPFCGSGGLMLLPLVHLVRASVDAVSLAVRVLGWAG